MSGARARPVFTALVYAWMTGLLALHALACLVMLPYTLLFDRDRRLASRLGSGMVRLSMRMTASGRVIARDLAVIDLRRPAILVINHRSILDIAIALAIPGAPRLSAKPWVARLPLFRVGMWAAGHDTFDPTDAGDVRRNLEYLERLLARGISVVFFPEGSRQVGDELGSFAAGAFWLAARTGVDVLPVVIRGCGDMARPGSAMIFHAEVRVEALPRIPAIPDRGELAQRARDAMSTRLAGSPAP